MNTYRSILEISPFLTLVSQLDLLVLLKLIYKPPKRNFTRLDQSSHRTFINTYALVPMPPGPYRTASACGAS